VKRDTDHAPDYAEFNARRAFVEKMRRITSMRDSIGAPRNDDDAHRELERMNRKILIPRRVARDPWPPNSSRRRSHVIDWLAIGALIVVIALLVIVTVHAI